MQLFLNALAAQCERHSLRAELILVEWNPPLDRPRLREVLTFPPNEILPVRIIDVPAEIHGTLDHADRLPLFQMIAKNVGIRRARGRFVLATNVDVLFSDDLAAALAAERLSENHVYRCDRCDVTSDIPLDAPIERQLQLCSERVIRINRFDATVDLRTGAVYRIYPKKVSPRVPVDLVLVFRAFEHAVRKLAAWGRGFAGLVTSSGGLLAWSRVTAAGRRARRLRPGALLESTRARLVRRRRARAKSSAHSVSIIGAVSERWNRAIAAYRSARDWERARIMLHTNASGDFTLMSQKGWEAVRGYPELELFSMHLDSLLLYEAHYSGLQERRLAGRLYHLEHASGFRPDSPAVRELNARLEVAAIPQISIEQFQDWVRTMFRRQAPIVFNGSDWGFETEVLAEAGTFRTTTGEPSAVVSS